MLEMYEKIEKEQDALSKEFVALREKRRAQEREGKLSPLLQNLEEQLELDRRNQEVMDELQRVSAEYHEKLFAKFADAASSN